MPLIYRILTAILAFTGCIGLIITGQMNPVMAVAGLGLIPGYYRFMKGRAHASKWVIGGLSIAALFVFAFDAVIVTGDVFIAAAHLTIFFQAIKGFDLKEPWDHLQVYFVSLLQLVMASELTRSIYFGFVFVIFLIALVTAMVISHFMKEGTIKAIDIKRPVVIISTLTLVITVLFFVSEPRLRGGLFGKSLTKGIKTAGFSQKVDFGSFGEVKLDPTIVMRVELDGKAKRPFYWRGMTLDYFDGTSWMDTLGGKHIVLSRGGVFNFVPFNKDDVITQRVFLEPIDSSVIFGLNTIAGIKADVRALLIDNAGAVFTQGKGLRRITYTAYSILKEQPVEGSDSMYLQLPPHLERVKALAEDIVRRDKTDMQKSRHIEQYLRTNYRYSLSTSKPPKGMSPIEYFLFDSKKGYCEHYATSMVLMLRSIGIQARIVTGFIGGEENRFGGYVIIRQKDAHSWVEAVINGRWTTFDPTPSTAEEHPSIVFLYLDYLRLKWDRYIVGFTSADQWRIMKAISMPLAFAKTPGLPLPEIHMAYYVLVPLFLIVFFLFLRRFTVKRYAPITARYLRLRKIMRKHGVRVDASSSPFDIKREAERLGIDIADIIELYQKGRFGGGLDHKDNMRYMELIGKVRMLQSRRLK